MSEIHIQKKYLLCQNSYPTGIHNLQYTNRNRYFVMCFFVVLFVFRLCHLSEINIQKKYVLCQTTYPTEIVYNRNIFFWLLHS